MINVIGDIVREFDLDILKLYDDDVSMFDDLDSSQNLELLKKMQIRDKIKIFYDYLNRTGLRIDNVFYNVRNVSVKEEIINKLSDYYLKMDLNSDIDKWICIFLKDYVKVDSILNSDELRERYSNNKYGFFSENSEYIFVDDEVITQVDMFIDYNRTRNLLINSNLRLVIDYLKQLGLSRHGDKYLDFVNVGNIGLMNAIDRFDVNSGNKLSTYAYFWIRNMVFKNFYNCTKVLRLPQNVEKDISKLGKIRRKLQFDLVRDPSYREIADEMGVSEKYISWLDIYKDGIVSLDLPVNEDSDDVLSNFVSSDDDFVSDLCDDIFSDCLKEKIEDSLGKLDFKKKVIIKKYFGIGCDSKTLEEIGLEFGNTHQAIEQQRNKALRLLRNSRELKEIYEDM